MSNPPITPPRLTATPPRGRRKQITFAVKSHTRTTKDFDCPYCLRRQSLNPLFIDIEAATLTIYQCISCTEIAINASIPERIGLTDHFTAVERRILPSRAVKRIPVEFKHGIPADVDSAYREACGLLDYHTAAAGAYARRALEIALGTAGYSGRSLDEIIKSALAEEDVDRKLPRNIRDRLHFIREIGNFAIHPRYDQALVMVNIDEPSVIACIDAVEKLISYVYEEKAIHYFDVIALNRQLSATSRKTLPVPERPSWIAESEGSEEHDPPQA